MTGKNSVKSRARGFFKNRRAAVFVQNVENTTGVGFFQKSYLQKSENDFIMQYTKRNKKLVSYYSTIHFESTFHTE